LESSENADHTMSENTNIVYFVALYFIPVSTEKFNHFEANTEERNREARVENTQRLRKEKQNSL